MAIPGPFSFRQTEYIPDILADCADPEVDEVVAVMGSQMSKTEGILLNLIGQRLDDDPVPIIVVFPTENAAANQFAPRLQQMLDSTASLRAKQPPAKANRLKTTKTVSGVIVRLAWAGSPTELASMAAGLVPIDEFDRMEPIKGEGDVRTLVKARGRTYHDFKTVVTSTPTLGTVTTEVHEETGIEHWKVADPEEVQSPTWQLWQGGTRYERAWPCPHCATYFIPRLKHLKWPKGATPAIARREAGIECPTCKLTITDAHKTQMKAASVYVSPGQRVVDGKVVGAPVDSRKRTRWVSGLMSPSMSFGEAAQEIVEAYRSNDPQKKQAVINTVFGECFSIVGEAVPWERLRAMCQDYVSGTVPDGVRVLTLTVDKQWDRLYYEVRGWGVRLQSWQITCGALIGDTTRLDGEVWDDLTLLQSQTFDGIPISLTLIDSGNDPDPVYAHVRRHPGDRVRATKGIKTMDQMYDAKVIDISIRGKKIPNGVKLYKLNTDRGKTFVTSQFPREADPQPTNWFLPQGVPESYLQQLTAEKRIQKRGGDFEWWVLKKANHFFDVAAMQVAAAYMLQVHRWTEQTAPRPPIRSTDEPIAPAPGATPTQTVGGREVVSRGYYGRGR